MNPLYAEFKRKFSFSMYKNLKIKLGEMSFCKDFVQDTRGDLYPIIAKSDDCEEVVAHNSYAVQKGMAKRLLCQFFPFATYELSAKIKSGEAGFCFKLADAEVRISVTETNLTFTAPGRDESMDLPNFARSACTLIVSCRPGAFDAYFKNNGKPEYLTTFYAEDFKDSNLYALFSDSYVCVLASGNVVVTDVISYMDNGISIADIRPIKYENGDPLLEQGMLYVTASVRLQEGAFQGVFSWIPGTADFRMTGAIFYDCGDGRWRNYVAPVILYHREKKEWYAWVSSFEHKHILANGAFEGDPRFGVNVVDVQIMPRATDTADLSVFAGFRGDEDPDLIYDAENRRWLLAVCRIDPKTGNYVYVFFESDDPFEHYRYIGQGVDGASETGGSFVRIDGELFFVCGNDSGRRSEYRIYSKNGMDEAKFKYPDGGFRGWGTVIPVRLGSRLRYFWLTFDRHNGSDYNWSYGNLYCFEV